MNVQLHPNMSPFAMLKVFETVESVVRGCCALHGLAIPATDWDRLKLEHLCAVWPDDEQETN